MVQLLSELREPPVVGRFYMVPVIEDYPWHGKKKNWPVLGPMHEDKEFFNFPDRHYHVDIRFVSNRLSSWAIRHLWWGDGSNDPERDLALVASAYPLTYRGTPLPTGRPALQRRRCFRASYSSPLGSAVAAAVDGMQAHYGSPAPAICRRDGRKLCPHRKVDLSQFPADENGIVVCPIHGLRVQVGMPA